MSLWLFIFFYSCFLTGQMNSCVVVLLLFFVSARVHLHERKKYFFKKGPLSSFGEFQLKKRKSHDFLRKR